MKWTCKSALAIVLAMTMIWTGCNTSWVNTAIQDVPVVLQIITGILNIVSVAQAKGQADPAAAATIQRIGAEASAGLKLTQQLISDYQAASSANKPGIAGKIDSAPQVTAQDLQQILAVAHVKDPATAAAINAAVELALTTVLAIQSLVPAPTTTKTARVPRKPMGAKELKKNYNAAVAAYPSAQIR